MIRINLLPYHLRPVKRTPLPYVLGVAIWVLALLYMASAYISTQNDIATRETEYAENAAVLAGLQPVIEKSNELEKQKIQLRDKEIAIQEIMKDRIIWSRQLWSLSRLAPDNFWYNTIRTTLKPMREKRPVIDPQTKLPKKNAATGQDEYRDETVQRPILEVSGYVVATPEAEASVNPLMYATENDQEFSSLFQLFPPRFKDTTFNEYPVRNFTVEYLIAPGAKRE
jgi:hypothetical protein